MTAAKDIQNKSIKKNSGESWNGWMIGENLFNWIKSNIKNGSRILELGSGKSTGLLAEFYEMYSIEDNKEWLNKYNSKYIYAPIKETTDWYDSQYLEGNLPANYELLLIDAPRAVNPKARKGILQNLALFNLDCTIIIDDTHREEERLLADDLRVSLKREVVEINEKNKKATILLKK